MRSAPLAPGGNRLRLFFLWLSIVPSLLAAADEPRLATMDWTLASTLVALGHTPVAVAQIDAYHTWVKAPELPSEVIDLGLRSQPNLELLAELRPDRILLSPRYSNLEDRLRRIAPVENLTLYSTDGDPWAEMESVTRELGELADRETAADHLIRETRDRMQHLATRLEGFDQPLLIVQFFDERHVRVFGANSLYDTVLDQLGLDNAWPGETNRWGFAQVPLERLADIDARLVIVRPFPAIVEDKVTDSSLWQTLPGVRRGDTITVPPVWSFGALPSARRFADALADALEGADD